MGAWVLINGTWYYIHKGMLSWVCDNYLIGSNGPGDRLHQFPEAIIEVG